MVTSGREAVELIDVWTHIFPPAYFARLRELATASGPLKRWMTLTSLYDLDARFQLMDKFPNYRQVLTPSMPAFEDLGDSALAADMARLMNDGLAELVATHPSRFVAFAGGISLLDVDAALAEIERATALGARGFQLPTHSRGVPLDDPKFQPIFDLIAAKGLAIWLHPLRGPVPDYPTEAKSKFEIWWCFGWPYDSSAAMARLVFSGLFDRHPRLRVITHHMGAMIPYFAGRIVQGWGLEMGARTPPSDSDLLPKPLQKSAIEYFKMFYADTALSGALEATRCGYDFFSAEKVLFASDFPFDAEGGSYLVRETIKAIDSLNLDAAMRRAVDADNAHAFLTPAP
jgi:aminocarboxymuconate-semialdehyde decarboxylase